MKKYDSYKDSGVEWIGEIPISWNKIKFSYVTKLMTCGHAATPEYVEDGGVPFLSAQNIKNEKIDLNVLKHVTDELHDSLIKNKKVEKGDLLQVRVGGADTIGQTAIVDLDFDFSIYVSLAHIKLNELAFNGYVKHLCNSVEFKEYCGVLMKKGAGVANLNVSDVASMKIPLPNFEEQTIIANYLDHKTTQIDHLIVKKEQFIQLLEEERVAVINQAVTKGLDPNVSMKDSGIEWLGEIPEHWEMKKLRFIGNCQNGISAGAEYFGKGFPFVSYGDVYKNEILPILVNGLAQSNEKEQLHYSIDEGDVLFTRTSETIEEIGISSICFQKIKGAVFAGFLIRFRPNEGTLNKNFSKYFFRSKIPRTFFVKEMNLVTRASLSQELLKRLPILLPPIEEQKKIGEFLNKKANEIDDIVGKTRNEIELLKEYKSALISEVVTGKVDVRNEKLN